jgi:hypothetical protein
MERWGSTGASRHIRRHRRPDWLHQGAAAKAIGNGTARYGNAFKQALHQAEKARGAHLGAPRFFCLM